MDLNEKIEIMNVLDERFYRIMNKRALTEKTPRAFGTEFLLYPAEIHTIEKIGHNSGINVTELAGIQGVTKGAVSQVVGKLVKKGLVIKVKDANNDRDVLLELTQTGQKAFVAHSDFHSKIHLPLTDLVATASRDNIEFVEKLFGVIEDFLDEVLITK